MWMHDGGAVEQAAPGHQSSTHRSLLNLALSMTMLGMPACQLAGSVPVRAFPDTCSVCRAGSRHAPGSVPAG